MTYCKARQLLAYSNAARTAGRNARLALFKLPEAFKRGREARLLLKAYRASVRLALTVG